MADRAVPMPTQIAEALLAELAKIGRDDETAWRIERPNLPRLFAGASDLTAARPGDLVRIVRVRPAPEQSIGPTHEEIVDIDVLHLSANAEGPQAALHDGVSDIRRAIRQNHTLGGLVMWLDDSGYDFDTDGVGGGAGQGMAIVRVHARYETDEENP